MGIKDLHKVMASEAPNYLIEYHYSELAGLRVAVDISVFLYKHIRTAGKPKWVDLFVLFLSGFKRHGVKMVCIFDGPNPPPEKKQEQDYRRSENKRSVDRMKRCIEIRNILQDKYIPKDKDLEPELMKECKMLISPQKGRIDSTNYYDVGDVVDSLNKKIEDLERQTMPITDEDREQAYKIVKALGLAAFKADGEAEGLCAYLAIHGEVDAVLTEDTDVLAYGTPFMLVFKKDKKFSDEKLYGIYLDSVLQDMYMTLEEFRDLCILLRCDYNKHSGSVQGYPPDGKKHKKPKNIGTVGALCMIREYRRLEEVCKHIMDPKPLMYRRCRELLTVPKKREKGNMVPYNKPLNVDELVKYLPGGKDSFSTKKMIEYVSKCYEPAKLTFIDDSSEEDEFENEQHIEEDLIKKEKLSEDELSSVEDAQTDLECELSKLEGELSEALEDLSDEELLDPYCVILCAECQNDKTEEEKCLEAHFKFMNEELWYHHDGTMFDELIEPFNNWLTRNNLGDWRVNGVIENLRSILPEDAIIPYVVTK